VVKRLTISEKGFSTGWFAVFSVFVLLPILAFVVDGARVILGDIQLQRSLDAACEAAALAADVDYFNRTGRPRIEYGTAVSNASQVFGSNTAQVNLFGYSPSLTAVNLVSETEVQCWGQAVIQPFIAIYSMAPITNVAQAKMRFVQSEP
jgi:hypothetical protein